MVQFAGDSCTWNKYITQPMWYSPQQTLTHGTSTSQTHTSHVVQSATDSHAWDKYITDTHSPCGTVCNGLSRMGQVHHRHIHPMWYSPQRTLTHETSTSQTHTHPMWYSPQRTLTHETSTSQTHTSHVVQSAADSHAWDKYIIDTHTSHVVQSAADSHA